ncbi:MAG: hypothetical protein H6857_01975 [Rhodospirillales bacterium]|nr:hypothetical protein [Rhodospirillales bacterium]
MSLPLEEHDIRTLYHKFDLPDLVAQWLKDPKNFQTANEYALHEALCSLHPEDALLCIALCLHSLEQTNSSPLLPPPLLGTTNQIIRNYGLEALERIDFQISNDDRMNIELVARDLTDLAHRLEQMDLPPHGYHPPAYEVILSALCIQANAQAEVARYVLKQFREQEQEQKTREMKPLSDIPFLKTFPVNDNRHN